MVQYTQEEWRAGRRRLKDLSGRAKARALKYRREDPAGLTGLVPNSGIGQNTMPHVTENRLEALIVYERGAGNWYADIAFKNMPEGLSNVMGTPTRDPLPSRVKAETAGFQLLVGLWATILENQAAKHDGPRKDERIFQLYGNNYAFTPADIERVSGALGDLGVGEILTPEIIGQQLEVLVKGIMGEGEFDHLKLEAADPDLQMQIQMRMMMLLSLRQVRYPIIALPESEAGPVAPPKAGPKGAPAPKAIPKTPPRTDSEGSSLTPLL